MAKQLKPEAIEKVNSDTKLFSDLCDMLDIRPSALISNLQRNSERMMRHDVVMAISEKMGLEPKDILEEKEEKQEATA